MRGYGLPRNDDVQHPDKGDILLYGLPSRIGKLKSKVRRRSRRIWKKIARKKEMNYNDRTSFSFGNISQQKL